MNLPHQSTEPSMKSQPTLVPTIETKKQLAGFAPAPSPARDILPRTILLVDDEEDLRCVMELILSMHGYCVMSCSTAELASATFKKASSISLLLTDMQMPGKSGIELARELTSLRPSLPVLIVSAGMPTSTARSEMNVRAWRFLSKTEDETTLAKTVAALLR